WREANLCLRREEWGDPLREASRESSAVSAQPTRRNAGAARFFLEIGDGRLVVENGFLEPRELRKRLVAVGGHHGALRRVVAVDEVGGQSVDSGLERIGIDLVTLKSGP